MQTVMVKDQVLSLEKINEPVVRIFQSEHWITISHLNFAQNPNYAILYDALGRQVQSQILDDEFENTIDVSSLTKGTYVLSLFHGQNPLVSKPVFIQ